jgi:xanthine/uracil permease
VTTYGEVTGAVMLTKNYNPVVMTWAAVFAILMAFVGKFGAFLQTIPMPVMGGIMMLLFGSIAGIGLKTIMDGRVDLASPRNLCIVSVTLVTGIGGLGVHDRQLLAAGHQPVRRAGRHAQLAVAPALRSLFATSGSRFRTSGNAMGGLAG